MFALSKIVSCKVLKECGNFALVRQNELDAVRICKSGFRAYGFIFVVSGCTNSGWLNMVRIGRFLSIFAIGFVQYT